MHERIVKLRVQHGLLVKRRADVIVVGQGTHARDLGVGRVADDVPAHVGFQHDAQIQYVFERAVAQREQRADRPVDRQLRRVRDVRAAALDIDQYDWAIRGCKAGQAPRKVQNIYYTNPQYPEFLRSKYQAIEDSEQRWESYQAEDADVVLVAYGISSRISKEAVNMARAEGFKLGLIRPITLWPYPVKAFETCKNAKAFMTVEINILGQMVDDVKLAVENKYPVGFYGTFFGLPEPEEIVAQAKAMLEKEGK